MRTKKITDGYFVLWIDEKNTIIKSSHIYKFPVNADFQKICREKKIEITNFKTI